MKPSIELGEWINSYYVELYSKGTLSNVLLKVEPYSYAYLEEVFLPKKFAEILEACKLIKDFETKKDFEVEMAHLSAPDLLRFLYSAEFRDFIGQIFCTKVVRKKDQLPSIRRFPEGAAGMPIHNDVGFTGHMTAFLYLSEWKPGLGGEVCVWNWIDREQKPIKADELPPKSNSILLMPITHSSYHSVNAMRSGWIRECAFFPLTIE